jgi:hypothetical protein
MGCVMRGYLHPADRSLSVRSKSRLPPDELSSSNGWVSCGMSLDDTLTRLEDMRLLSQAGSSPTRSLSSQWRPRTGGWLSGKAVRALAAAIGGRGAWRAIVLTLDS